MNRTWDRIEELWQSRKLTVVFVAVYSLWIVVGSILAMARFHDVDASVEVEAVYVYSPKNRVSVHGRAIYHLGDEQARSKWFVGDTVCRVCVGEEPGQRLRLDLRADNVVRDAELTIGTPMDGKRYTVRDLNSYQVAVWLPLDPGEQEFRFSIDQERARVLFADVRLEDADPSQPGFRQQATWMEVKTEAETKILLGSGWSVDEPEELVKGRDSVAHMGRRGHLRLVTTQPGQCAVVIPWAPFGGSRENKPRFLLDGQALASTVRERRDNLEFLELHVDLSGTNDLEILFEGTIKSPYLQHGWPDFRFISYQVYPRWVRIER